MPKVFIPAIGPHDFTPAEKYGELVYLTDGSLSPYAIGRLIRLLVRKLRDSTPKDYLLVTSHTNLNLLCAAILSRKHGGLNLLVFGKSGYTKYSLHLDELLNLYDNGTQESSPKEIPA